MAEQPMMQLDFDYLDDDEMLARSRSLCEAFVTRRSVRDFDSRPVSREVIENAITSAGSAPSGANMQPWHFVVVTDPEVKSRLRMRAEETERSFHAERITEEWREALEPLDVDTSKPFLEEASALIIVFRRNHVIGEDGSLHKTYYPMESVGIAIGMLIASLHLAGVASLPYTPSPMGFLAEELGRPETDYAFLVLAVGYPKEGATVPLLSREPLERIATFMDAP